jgi:hypothetical protein
MFASMTDEEVRVAVLERRRQLVRLEAEWLALTAELDRRQAWAIDGSLSAGAWLARHGDLPASTAREKVRVARKLENMPATAAAFAAGAVGWAHVRCLARALNDRTRDAFARDEAMLLEQARNLDAEQFAVVVRRWESLVDQDGPKPPAFDRRRNAVRLAESFQGRWFGALNLDAESGAIVSHAIDAIAEELFRTGDAAASLRPAAERRAEALVELARRGLASGQAARPLVIVHLDLDPEAARLDDGTMVRGETARRLACDASVARVITAGGSQILDLGRSTRTPSATQRRALSAIHDTCAFPGCRRPFRWCELHHLTHWLDGGPTDLDNLLPLCSRHHHLHHEGRFRITRHHGELIVHDPAGVMIGTIEPAGARPAAAA